MDRRKNELKATFEKLRLESTGIVQQLNTILDKHQETIARIESLTDKQILANSQYFIAASQSQYNSLLKLTNVSMDLETYIANDDEAKIVVNPSLSGSLINLSQLCDTTQRSNSQMNNDPVPLLANNNHNSTLIEINNYKCVNELPNTEINTNSTLIDNESDADVIIESVKTDYSTTSSLSSDFNKTKPRRIRSEHTNTPKSEEIEEKQRVETTKPLKTEQKDASKSEEIAEIQRVEKTKPRRIKKNAVKSQEIEEIQRIEKTEQEIESEETRRIEKPRSAIQNNEFISKKVEENTEKAEITECKVESVTEKLAKSDYMSRRDRYLQSIPKPTMPDLSFKLAETSSSEYYSAGENVKAKKTKKHQENTTKRTNKTLEDLKCTYEIREAEEPHLNETCVIMSYISPAEFYITCITDDTDALDSLNMQLEEFCTSSAVSRVNFTSKSIARTVIDKFCSVHCHEYNTWCRGEVIDWMEDESCVRVQLIDYGQFRMVPLKDLSVLPNFYCYYPKFVIKCHLAHLYPPGSTRDNVLTKWPVETLSVLEHIVTNAEENFFKIVFMSKTSDSLAVDLVSYSSPNQDYTLGQKLMDEDLASEIIFGDGVVQNNFIKDQLKSAQNMWGITDKMSTKEQLSQFCENMTLEEPANLAVAMTNYDAQDDVRICKFTRSNGTCFKGKNCKLDHGVKRKDGYTTDKRETYICAFNILEMPSSLEFIQIIVTYVLGVNQFYGHIKKHDRKGKSLKEMMEFINQDSKKYKAFDVLPMVGEIVLAKNWDKKWYRAMVVEVDSHIEKDLIIQVFSVDYGDIFDVTLEEICQISAEMLSLPFQAVKFKIGNILPIEGTKTEEEKKEYFEDNYLGKILVAKVICLHCTSSSYSGAGFVEVLLYNAEHNDIGQELVEAGCAAMNIDCLVPKATEDILVD